MKKSLVIILLLLSNMSFSQTLYNKLYLDGITAESIITMDAAVTSDGGSVAVGLIESGGIDQSLVVKLDANGDTSWVRRANDAISSYYSSVEVNSAGEIVVGGSTGVTESDATLTKYDNSGNLIWANKLELQGAFGEYLNAYLNFEPVEKPQISVDGTDVILATNSKDGMFDSTRVHVAKVNSAGSLVWTTTFNFMDGLMAPYYDVDEGSLSGVEVLSNGNIALCGGFIDRFTVKYSWVVLLDPNGNYIDEKVIVTSGGSSWIKFYDLIEMPNGDILLAGTGLNVPGSSNYGMLLSRFDASLNYISTNHYNTSGTCKEIEHAPSGGYYAIVEGMDLAFDGSNRNGVVKLDASLNVEWAKMYGSSNSDYANAVDVFPNGDIMIVGRSAGFTAGGSFKAYMVRADSDGFVPGCWVETVNFTNDTITLSISNLTESVGVSGAFSPIGGADFPIELEISDINIDFSGVSTEPLCTGEQGGVDVIIASINSPYTFQWSNGTSSADITDFSGDYNVLIRDAYGCVETDTFSIVDPTALSASYATSDVTCFGFGNGSINLTPTGGTPGYTYDW